MDWTYNTIWTEQLPPGQLQKFKWRSTKAAVTQPVAGSYFMIRNFNPKDRCFVGYPAVTTATYLELAASNVRFFRGISKLGPIKRLELHYCTKLESDEGLSELEHEIEWLHINHSKKFSPSEELLRLRNLKVLCLNCCAPLENLVFLREFPELRDFRFVNTTVIDGDLTPLFQHPTLVNAGFLNKRHYDRTVQEADDFFRSRFEAATECLLKGEFKTFRYKTFAGAS